MAFEQEDGELSPPMVSKMVGIHITRDQSLRLETPGGGGYGAALERDPQRVAEDVRLGYVSAEAADKNYGVVLNADGSVDDAQTHTRRKGAGQ